MSNENAISDMQSWITDREKELEETKERHWSLSERSLFIKKITDVIEKLSNFDDVEKCMDLIFRFHSQHYDDDSEYNGNKDYILWFMLVDTTDLKALFDKGEDAYKNKIFSASGKIFKFLSETGYLVGTIRYASMLRRGEFNESADNLPLKALHLLQEVIKETDDACALVNAALTFALCFGTDEDWKIADDIMKNLPASDIVFIRSEWGSLARKGETEGYLVHFFLLRHGKIQSSEFATLNAFIKRISFDIPTFPHWLKHSPRFRSLSDVMEAVFEDDFMDVLSEYLSEMPRNRASAEEILKEIFMCDVWEMYSVLLTDFRSFLTKAEFNKVITAYKDTFSIPLSSIINVEDNE